MCIYQKIEDFRPWLCANLARKEKCATIKLKLENQNFSTECLHRQTEGENLHIT